MTTPHVPSEGLPPQAEEVLKLLIASAETCFGADLVSIILFGSGAEGKLRPTSDLNLLVVLEKFDREKVDAFREPWRLACVAGNTKAMFLLRSELNDAVEAFAVKFDDIGRRRRVLYGEDVLVQVTASRNAKIQRLRQVLLNFTLRLRERYASVSLREEQLAEIVANAAGPLRSSAATLLELEGKPALTPREALTSFVSSLPPMPGNALDAITAARTNASLPPGAAGPAVFELIQIAEAMKQRANLLT